MSDSTTNFSSAIQLINTALNDFMETEYNDVRLKANIDNSNELVSLLHEGYVIITWPDVQELMEEEWFDEEAILETEGKFGSSAYFVPIKYLI